jgi:hypothetical protein
MGAKSARQTGDSSSARHQGKGVEVGGEAISMQKGITDELSAA